MKEMIGIEALLHRAYGQYRVDKVTPAAVLGLPRFKPAGSLVGVMSALQLGTIVDNSGAAARMLGHQTMAAATPDDLLVVHDHVLALSDWLIERAAGGEPQVWKRAEIVANGWRVENAATGLWLVRPGDGGPVDGEAWSRLLDPFLAALVIEHARSGSAPDHGGSLVTAPGRPDQQAQRDRRFVLEARAVYAAWHAALALLAVDLDAALTRHRVLGPISTAAPWEAETRGNLIASQAKKQAETPKLTRRKTLKQHYNR